MTLLKQKSKERQESFASDKRSHATDAQNLFEENVYIHLDPLYNYARCIIHTSEEAEALVQKTFVRAYQNFKPKMFSRGSETWKVWIFCILKHLHKTSFEPGKKPFLKEATVDPPTEVGPNIYKGNLDDQPFTGIEPEAVLHHVEHLPEPSRSCLILASVEDFSYREISIILSMPRESVQSELKQARKHLKEKLYDLCHSSLSI